MQSSRPEIAVTGAVGFIGSQILEALLNIYPASALVAVDHPLTSAKLGNAQNITRVNLLNHETFLAQLEDGQLNPKIVIHMGACSSTTESNWDYLYANNVVYSQKIYNWCAQNQSRFIYASSAATYGDGELGFDDEVPIEQLKPINLYGRSKHEFDIWTQHQKRNQFSPPQCVGLKFFNVFGNGESHKGRMASMALHGYLQAISIGHIKLFKSNNPAVGDGEQSRDFVYVKDVVRVILQLIEKSNISGIYNLGTGTSRTFNDLATAVMNSLNLRVDIKYIPMPSDLHGRYQYTTCATTTKLDPTGISPLRTALEDAIGDYIINLNQFNRGCKK